MRKGISLSIVLFLVLSQFVFVQPAAALSAANVTVTPPIAGKEASYSIAFTTGALPAHEIPASTGYIRITFPSGTTIPTTITAADVTINAVATPSNPTVSGSSVRVMVPSSIAASSPVTLLFALNAGIKNPTSTTGNLKLKVETGYLVGTTQTVIESAVDSNPYFIGSPATVTPAVPTDLSTFVEYKVVWKLGNEGALSKNSGTITLTFPPAFDMPDGAYLNAIPGTYIMVNNTRLNASATCTKALPADPLVITFTTPIDLANNANVTVILTNQVGMKNPIAGDYTIQVKTSKENTDIQSESFAIVNAVKFNIDLDPVKPGIQGVVVEPPVVSAEAEYVIAFQNNIPLSVNVGTITIAFPTGTMLPTSIPSSAVIFDVGGTVTDLVFTPARSGNNVTITVPVNIPANSDITITFQRSLKVKNPSTANIYHLQVMTSSQPHYRVSTPYAIGTAVTGIKVTPSPDTSNTENVQYLVEFKLGANGALTANTDKIYIMLKVAAPVMPSTLTPASVLVGNDRTLVATEVENTTLPADPLLAGYQRFIVTPPKDIAANQTVKVTFLSSAGLKNPTPESLRGYVRTNKEPILSDSPFYLIVDAAEVGNIVVDPPSSGVEAGYTIPVTIGQALAKDTDTITIAFPMATTVPTSIAPGSITVNGLGLNFAPTVSGRNITFRVPANYPATTLLTIEFTKAVKIKNPTTPGLYTLQVMTSMQPNYRVSPPYGIGSSVTNVKVTPTPDTASTTNAVYVVEFKLGANGALSGNTDKIYIMLKLDAPVMPSTLPPASVLVGNDRTVISTEIENTTLPADALPAGYIRLVVTPPKDIAANQNVKVTFLASAGLQNPLPGSLRAFVRTNKEPIVMDSAYYLIVDAVLVGNVVVDPPSTSSEASYTFPITIGRAMVKDIDTVTVAFPQGNTIPTNITPGSITVNGLPLNFAPTISSRNVTFRVPDNYIAGTVLNIVFTKSAKIKNPTTAGLYELQVMTSMQPNYRVSPPYGIGTSVSGLKITPSPQTKLSTDVQYVVEFRLGANGALRGNTDKIVLLLPLTSPLMPSTIPGSSVMVGNDLCTIAIAVENTTAPVDALPGVEYVRIIVTPPKDIASSQNVKITFLPSAGLQNPNAGNWRAYARTSQEPIVVESDYYLIADAIDITAVNVNPPSVSVEAQYTITIDIGTNLNQNTGTITVSFPTGTTIPTTIPTSAVQITQNAITQNLTVNPQVSGTRVIITVPMNLIANPLWPITLVFQKSAGIKNPTKPGLYTLQMMTSAQPYFRESPMYTIGSSVSAVKIIPMPNTMAEQNVEYHVEFKTGAVNLRANLDQIFVWLPISGVGPSPLSPATILVNGVYTSLSTTHVLDTINAVNYQKFMITVPAEVKQNSTAKVVFLSSCALANPLAEGIYKGYVATSLEDIPIESELYGIVDSVTFPGFIPPGDLRSVLPKPNAIKLPAQYLLSFRTTIGKPTLQANIGTVSVVFPAGTKVPGTISAGSIYVSKTPTPIWAPGTPDNVVCNPPSGTVVTQPVIVSGQEVTFRTPMDIFGGETVYVLFCLSANIENPPDPGLYHLQIKTSSQPNYGISRSYLIRSTIEKPVVTPIPAVTAELAEYTIRFKLGAQGALTPNVDKIFLAFKKDPLNVNDYTTPPAGNLAPSTIRVNGVFTTAFNIVQTGPVLPPNVDNAPGWAEYRWIEIQSPMALEASQEVTIQILESAGLINPINAGNHMLVAWTNKEPVAIGSFEYILGDAIKNVTVPVSHPNPRTAGSIAEYQVSFNLGTSPVSALQANVSTVTVTFPEGTVLPTSINPADIKICQGPACVPTSSALPPVAISGQSVQFIVPINIAAGSSVTVLFTKGAKISNPETPASYRLKVRTSSQPIDAHSNYYTILSTSGIPKVSADPAVINYENTAYTVEFTSGQNGSLSAGIDKIIVFFDPSYIGVDYNVGFNPNPAPFPALNTAVPPQSIYVNDVPIVTIPKVVNSGPQLSYMEITVPADIPASTPIKVLFMGIVGIKNPNTVGAYRLALQTTSEPTPVESMEFSLFSSITAPLVTLSVSDATPPKPKGTSPHAKVQVKIDFNTGPAGNLVKDIGTLSIEFPFDTYLPLAFAPGSIRVNGITLVEAPVVDLEHRKITMKTPVHIASNAAVEIIFTELAGVRNPTQPGNYTLKVASSSEPLFIRSTPYVIEGLSAASVEVDPCLFDSAMAKYHISFQNTLPILSGSTIIIEFPHGTKLPSVIQGSYVLVNGRPANVGTFPQVAVNLQTVEIKVPENIPGLSVIDIVFLPEARITNPPSGNYMLKIRTNTADPDFRFIESQPYYICQLISLASVEITPQNPTLEKNSTRAFTAIVKDDQGNEVKSGLQFNWTLEGTVGNISPNNARTVTFTAGSQAGKGKLSVQVRAYGTPDPVTASTDITIAASLASITISPSSATVQTGKTQTFTATAKDELGATLNIDVDWTLIGALGSLSPAKGKTTTFTASSTEGTGQIKASATFGGVSKEATSSITVSSEAAPPPPPPPPPPPADVQPFTVVVAPSNVRSSQAEINFSFTVSALANVDNGLFDMTIPEAFPAPILTSSSAGFVEVKGGAGVELATPISINQRTITITVTKMTRGQIFTLSYSRVTAPERPGEYVFICNGKAKADASMKEVTEQPKVTVVSASDGAGRATIQPNEASAGAIGQQFAITFIADAIMDGGAISVTIPDGWSRPSLNATSPGFIKMGEMTAEVGSLEVSGNVITLPIEKLDINQKFTILYTNVEVPKNPNTYSFLVKSKGLGGTLKPIVLNPSVKVDNTRIADGKVEVKPNMTNTPAEYSITFRSSLSGFLPKDIGKITLVFPAETTLPSSIPSDQVTVNGKVVTQAIEVDPLRSTLSLSVPEDLPSNSLIIVKFSEKANIINPKTPKEDYRIMISTTSDSIPTASANFRIVVSLLRNVKVSVSPIVPGASAAYNIKLMVGGAGALNINQDTITLVFPSDTVLPATIAANSITVNGTPLQVRPQIDIAQRKLTLSLPVRIENDAEVTIDILSSANLKNPTRDGMYKLKVSSSKESNPVESEAYQIGTSLLGDVKVSLSSSVVETPNVTYTVSFRTGAYGSLNVGDTITVNFDRRYRHTSIQAYQVSVNGVVLSITPEIQEGHIIVLKTPIAVSAQSNVTLAISGITNPSEAGEYTLSLATQAEPMPVVSTPYRVGMVLETKITINPEEANGLAGWYTIAPNILFTNEVSSAQIFYSWDQGNFQLYTGGSIRAPEGIHLLTWYSTAENFEDEAKQSMQFKVDTKAPMIRITKPVEGFVATTPTLVVEGEVDEEHSFTVNVNERPATVTDKRFSITVTLNPGENWLDIVATDEAGNRSISPRMRVNYAVPAEIKFNITSPKALSFVYPELKPAQLAGSFQLTAAIRVTGTIQPANANTLNVIILGKMEKALTIPIAADGSFDGVVNLPVTAGLNGITFSVTDTATGKDYSTSVAVVSKVTVTLQIGNALAFMNDKEYRLDAPPYIKNSRTMLPMRFIGESFGATIGWNAEQRKVSYTLDNIVIELVIGNVNASVKRGEKTEQHKLDVAPEIVNGRTFVPVRFVSEQLGAEIKWDANTKKVTIVK